MATALTRPVVSTTHPFHALLAAYPIACFSGAFLTATPRRLTRAQSGRPNPAWFHLAGDGVVMARKQGTRIIGR
jgi:hypothetical protein